jgi:hypothetical protein
MKKLVSSLFVLTFTFNVFSQKTFDALVLDVNYIEAPATQSDNLKDFVIGKMDSTDGFYMMYHIDLYSGFVTTSVDENSILDSYKIISADRSNNHIELTIVSNNNISFLCFNFKRKNIISLIHYRLNDNHISGISSIRIDN